MPKDKLPWKIEQEFTYCPDNENDFELQPTGHKFCKIPEPQARAGWKGAKWLVENFDKINVDKFGCNPNYEQAIKNLKEFIMED